VGETARAHAEFKRRLVPLPVFGHRQSNVVQIEILEYMSRHFLSPCASLRQCFQKNNLFFESCNIRIFPPSY